MAGNDRSVDSGVIVRLEMEGWCGVENKGKKKKGSQVQEKVWRVWEFEGYMCILCSMNLYYDLLKSVQRVTD